MTFLAQSYISLSACSLSGGTYRGVLECSLVQSTRAAEILRTTNKPLRMLQISNNAQLTFHLRYTANIIGSNTSSLQHIVGELTAERATTASSSMLQSNRGELAGFRVLLSGSGGAFGQHCSSTCRSRGSIYLVVQGVSPWCQLSYEYWSTSAIYKALRTRSTWHPLIHSHRNCDNSSRHRSPTCPPL